MKSAKWVWAGIGLQFGTGYTVAYLVYTIGTLLTGATLNIGAALVGLGIVAVFGTVIIGLIVRNTSKIKAEYALNNGN